MRSRRIPEISSSQTAACGSILENSMLPVKSDALTPPRVRTPPGIKLFGSSSSVVGPSQSPNSRAAPCAATTDCQNGVRVADVCALPAGPNPSAAGCGMNAPGPSVTVCRHVQHRRVNALQVELSPRTKGGAGYCMRPEEDRVVEDVAIDFFGVSCQLAVIRYRPVGGQDC